MKQWTNSVNASTTHLLLMLVTMLILASTATAQLSHEPQDKLIDSPMKLDPLLPVAEQRESFDPRLVGLWFQALNQADSRTRFQAAAAIAKAASQGMQGLDIMSARLATLVESADEQYVTRQSSAKALIALDAKEHASVLWTANVPSSREMVLLTDPALARWQYAPAIEGWRTRLMDQSVSLVVRTSAARSLGQAADKASQAKLTTIALDQSEPEMLRLEAARAFKLFGAIPGNAQGVSMPPNARIIDKVVVAMLLGMYEGNASTQQLVKLAGDLEPAVAIVAAELLLKSQPTAIDTLLEKFSQSGDTRLRIVAIDRLSQRQEASSAKALAVFLSDQDPQLRVMARDKLIAMAPTLREAVAAVLLSELRSESVFAQQQSALATGAIDLKTAAPKLLELIESKTADVSLAAAVSLRKLQVEETFAPALAYVQKNMAATTPGDRVLVSTQMVQMFGLVAYEPANETLVKLVPKNSGSATLRAAAIWALGKLHEGKPDVQLTRDLTRRANDGAGMEPEDSSVREQSAIAIGRMKDKRSLKLFQGWIKNESDPSLATAGRWAVGYLTGERPEEPEPTASNVTGWFLQPLGNPQ